MIIFFEKIFFGIYLQNIKYAVDKEMAAIKAVYFLSFLVWSNLISIACFFILFSFSTIENISSYFWLFFFCGTSIIVAIFFYSFYIKMKKKLSVLTKLNHRIAKDTLSPKLIANVYIVASILIDILAFLLCVKN